MTNAAQLIVLAKSLNRGSQLYNYELSSPTNPGFDFTAQSSIAVLVADCYTSSLNLRFCLVEWYFFGRPEIKVYIVLLHQSEYEC